jgi:hypothetical protein
MSAPDTVLQIVPHLPGTFDGVGDYAMNLAKALSRNFQITTTFLVAGRTDVKSREGYAVVSGLNEAVLGELAPKHSPVVLHYVNYGYQSRGVPFQLRKFARALRGAGPRGWVTVLHELYASGAPWQSAFWVRPIQVRIARDLIDLSDLCIVSNLPIKEEVHRYDREKRIELLPVMSNFGEPDLGELDHASPRRWAICGGTALIERSLSLFEERRHLIPEPFTPNHLDIVGGRATESIRASVDRLKHTAGLSVHHYPEVTVDLASEVLRQSSFGWIDYFGNGAVWPTMLLKSTAFAALCAHGVIPVLSHSEGPIVVDNDPLPGPYHMTSGEIRFPDAPDDLVSIRTKHYGWYHAHASSRRAAQVYAKAIQ